MAEPTTRRERVPLCFTDMSKLSLLLWAAAACAALWALIASVV